MARIELGRVDQCVNLINIATSPHDGETGARHSGRGFGDIAIYHLVEVFVTSIQLASYTTQQAGYAHFFQRYAVILI